MAVMAYVLINAGLGRDEIIEKLRGTPNVQRVYKVFGVTTPSSESSARPRRS